MKRRSHAKKRHYGRKKAAKNGRRRQTTRGGGIKGVFKKIGSFLLPAVLGAAAAKAAGSVGGFNISRHAPPAPYALAQSPGNLNNVNKNIAFARRG